MVKELGLLKIIIPDEFVARGIIAKLHLLWRNFTTAFKHKRVHMSILELITSLDVEKKARAKDGRSKGAKGQTSANIWCTSHSHMGKAKAKLSGIRITTSQSKLLPLRRRRRIRRMRVASCADLRIIGQRSVQITKEENLNLRKRLQTWLYPALEMELLGMVIYHMFF
jgi:hypothetical protein